MSRILRLLVAVGLTTFVIYQNNPPAIAHAIVDARWTWLAAALGLVLLDRTLMAARWIDLLAALTPGTRPPFGSVLRIFFVSSFVSNFVPSVAADMYRAYALANAEVRLAESTASVLMDRVLGVLSMALVGAVALLAAPDVGLDRWFLAGLGATFAACAAAAFVVFSERAARLVIASVAVIPSAWLHRVTASLMDAVRRYASHHAALARVLAMSVAVQMLRILQAWCLGVALHVTLPLAAYFVFVPIVLVVMQVPVTVNGFGTTQVAFDRLFVPAGAQPEAVVALSLLFLVLGMIGTLPGAVLYGAGTRPPAASAHPS